MVLFKIDCIVCDCKEHKFFDMICRHMLAIFEQFYDQYDPNFNTYISNMNLRWQKDPNPNPNPNFSKQQIEKFSNLLTQQTQSIPETARSIPKPPEKKNEKHSTLKKNMLHISQFLKI